MVYNISVPFPDGTYPMDYRIDCKTGEYIFDPGWYDRIDHSNPWGLPPMPRTNKKEARLIGLRYDDDNYIKGEF